MNTITLPITNEYSCDVLVVGGGVTGFSAAVCAAREGDEAAVMLTRFCVEDNESAEDVRIELDGFGPCQAEIYLLDEEHDGDFVKVTDNCQFNSNRGIQNLADKLQRSDTK